MSVLTRDNLHLSRPKIDTETASDAPTDRPPLPASVADYIRESIAPNTRTAYLSDLSHFESWGGQIPATPETIAAYLVAHAETLSVASLTRRSAALAKIHRSKGLENPAATELVKSTMRGIRRLKGSAQRQAKPLIKEDLIRTLEAIGDAGPRDLRDRALLLVGFAGAFRRSELVSLRGCDIEFVRQGMVVTLQRSKTDQFGVGRKIGIPYARGRWCPVAVLDDWLTQSPSKDGAIFRPIDRHGRVGTEPLSGEAVALILRERLLDAGIDPKGFSGHSLRAGLATSAAQVGVPLLKIRQQTGHASDGMLLRYIRDGELFRENAVSAVL